MDFFRRQTDFSDVNRLKDDEKKVLLNSLVNKLKEGKLKIHQNNKNLLNILDSIKVDSNGVIDLDTVNPLLLVLAQTVKDATDKN